MAAPGPEPDRSIEYPADPNLGTFEVYKECVLRTIVQGPACNNPADVALAHVHNAVRDLTPFGRQRVLRGALAYWCGSDEVAEET